MLRIELGQVVHFAFSPFLWRKKYPQIGLSLSYFLKWSSSLCPESEVEPDLGLLLAADMIDWIFLGTVRTTAAAAGWRFDRQLKFYK